MVTTKVTSLWNLNSGPSCFGSWYLILFNDISLKTSFYLHFGVKEDPVDCAHRTPLRRAMLDQESFWTWIMKRTWIWPWERDRGLDNDDDERDGFGLECPCKCKY